ncbi:hypothetical protein QA584_07855 [Anaerocolumna sp. AGMB13025]|uniref:hypothetical protein n=1 Tax=Anaerocolumna sp. AGMB13025 TaxID=3039116 RepID=UPI00241D535D|nr:hypothetical protein [Anaerocolumna sp. AGMB13025]WFR58983.1 hypothetical protein QA584_07855 [Anaerocolumna sp. AGMB13025]
MKLRTFLIFLGIEAVFCVVLNIIQASFSGMFSAVMAFPFEELGILLRMLSLPGGIGNIAAIVIYTLVSLLPAAGFLMLSKKQNLHLEDGLLLLLSAVLFGVLYLMINPGLINPLFSKMKGFAITKAMLGGIVYSLLCGYLILRVLRLCYISGTKKLQNYMIILLRLLNVIFVYMIFGASLNNLLNSISVLREGNRGSEHLLSVSIWFLVLQYAVDVLPYLFNLLVVFAGIRLLVELQTDRYSNDSVTAALKLSRLCVIALAATVLTNIVFNLLQLLFARKLMVINSTVQLPVLFIIFVLAVLLFSRFIAENKQLKDDIDMFI